jgi:hypothetical protein
MVARLASEEQRRNNYRLDHVCNLGAQPLGVEGGGHTVWIRRRFSLEDNDQERQEEGTDEQ